MVKLNFLDFFLNHLKNKIMKNIQIIKLITLLISLNCLFSCSSDSCDYDTTPSATVCNVSPNNTEKSGFTVCTQYNSDPNGFVGQIVDTQMNSTFNTAEDLNPTITSSSGVFQPANWTPADIGQIFGIAIDDDNNIYLAASTVYTMSGYVPSITNARPAQVYKCAPPTYNAVALYTLPNSGIDPLNGIGNIAYDKINKQLFTTNLEDGKIYRHSLTGALLGSIDPWAADSGTNGIAPQDERVWGIGVNYESNLVKIYFPRITSAGTREIYSITLQADGSFPTTPNPEVLEISNVPGTQLAITDIAFSSDTMKMLLAERGAAHDSKIMSYNRTGTTWTSNLSYFIGGFTAGKNSAGGVDFAYEERGGNINSVCDEFFWGTGNYMQARNTSGKIYGMEGIKYSGNNAEAAVSPTANQDTDFFYDFNGTLGTQDKGFVGDVEVFDCNECFDICPASN